MTCSSSWMPSSVRILSAASVHLPEREFFTDNLLVRVHFIMVMIRWTGLAPWEFESPFLSVHLPSCSQFKNKYFAGMCSGSEAGSRLRLIDFCITQLQAWEWSRRRREDLPGCEPRLLQSKSDFLKKATLRRVAFLKKVTLQKVTFTKKVTLHEVTFLKKWLHWKWLC